MVECYILYVLVEQAYAGVPGQLKAVEAGVAFRVRVFLVVLYSLYVELLVLSPVALQILESEDGHSSIARHEV